MTDISYIYTKWGVWYLSVTRNLCGDRVVTYETGTERAAALVLDAILKRRTPYENAMAESFFSIRKAKCIYSHKPAAVLEADETIGHRINFYRCEPIQTKPGEVPLA